MCIMNHTEISTDRPIPWEFLRFVSFCPKFRNVKLSTKCRASTLRDTHWLRIYAYICMKKNTHDVKIEQENQKIPHIFFRVHRRSTWCYVYACTHRGCVYACMRICVCVYAYMRMFIYAYMHICVYAYMRICLCKRTCSFLNMKKHMRLYADFDFHHLCIFADAFATINQSHPLLRAAHLTECTLTLSCRTYFCEGLWGFLESLRPARWKCRVT
jgi:hypothetical protein